MFEENGKYFKKIRIKVKSCLNCGSEIKSFSKFCPVCGKKIEISDIVHKLNAPNNIISPLSTHVVGNDHEVKQLLEEDEKILYQRIHRVNIIEEASQNIYIGVIFFIPIILPYLIFLASLNTKKLDVIGFITGIVIILIFIPLYPLTKGLKKYSEIKSRTKLPRKELKQYLEFSVLTDKRWISKVYINHNRNFSMYTEYVVKIKGDIVSLDNSHIHFKYSPTENNSIIMLEIFLNPIENVKFLRRLNERKIFLNEFEVLLKILEENFKLDVQRNEDGSGIIQIIK